MKLINYYIINNNNLYRSKLYFNVIVRVPRCIKIEFRIFRYRF